jgi:uncharacterized membrane protein YqjE
VRLLWSLPKAAPALLRHLVGYVELAGQDLEQTQRDVGASLVAGAVLLLSLFFLIFSGCLLVVALTWDTVYRVPAILWMGGVFLAVAVVAGWYRRNLVSGQAPFLATVRREWREDRVILDRILAPDED